VTAALSKRLIRMAGSRAHLPRRTLRLRLTLLYGGLFLLSGAALLAITYLLVVNATSGFIFSSQTDHGQRHATIVTGIHDRHPVFAQGQSKDPGAAGSGPSPQVQSITQLQTQADRQHAGELHQLLVQSAIALAGMALASILLGWVVAGRALRPLREITQTAREISATNLHRRLALGGPDDELKDLGDTIDALLVRLEDSFQAQRAFVANASHELRTPLALTRAMLQFSLADPQLSFDELKATCADVLDAGAEHEQLVEALLTLAQGQRGIERHEAFDLAAIVQEAIDAQRSRAGGHEVTIHAALRRAWASGDPRLVRRLVSNLLENALGHNIPGGHVRVRIEPGPGLASLTIVNTGPRVPADQIGRLTQPFQRLVPDRTAGPDGHGLGLSIVAAIAAAHGANLDIRPNPDGGLLVAVAFPARAMDVEAERVGEEDWRRWTPERSTYAT
jgi:signal transduction histidine kinase